MGTDLKRIVSAETWKELSLRLEVEEDIDEAWNTDALYDELRNESAAGRAD